LLVSESVPNQKMPICSKATSPVKKGALTRRSVHVGGVAGGEVGVGGAVIVAVGVAVAGRGVAVGVRVAVGGAVGVVGRRGRLLASDGWQIDRVAAIVAVVLASKARGGIIIAPP
jgi:hypothetical protein